MRLAMFFALGVGVVGTSATADAKPKQELAAAEEALATGHYEEVAKLVGKIPAAALVKPGERAEADGLIGESLLRLGRLGEARLLLESTLGREEKPWRARLALGRVYRLQGEDKLAKSLWNKFYDDYESGMLDKKNAHHLAYVAQAARYLEGWKDANDTFRDAVDADEKGKDGARANIEWAELFLEKYDAGHAEQSLEEALKILPQDADAHALKARVKLEQSYDIVAAEKEIAQALKRNPRHALALNLRAEILVDNEEYGPALTAVAELRRTNPGEPRARAIAAAAALLSDDKARYIVEREAALKQNPHDSQFFHGVAEFLVRAHRYEEAVALEKEAIEKNKRDWVAEAALGAALLRLGIEPDGVAALQAAWKGDHFNVRTYNLLNLYEDVIPKAYVTVEGTPFRLRVPKSEQKMLERYVTPMLAKEYKELVARYAFTPKGPLTVEIYTNPEHYAVRTVGLPGLDALGVTFWNVITAMSPSLGRFNWGMTLWHEVGHVFSIQLSRSRVPRWFTEGLSEYETARHDPEWSRHTHAELYRAASDGKLLSVDRLNAGFLRARDISHMVVAYHQAAETVAFLIRRWGFDKAVLALRMYGDCKTTKQVIPAVTGLDVAAFDTAFKADLLAQLAPYKGTFYVRPSDYSDVDGLAARIKEKPTDMKARGLYALALVRSRHLDEAKKVLEVADVKALLAGVDKQKQLEVILAAAEIARLSKEFVTAKFFYMGLTTIGGDGYDARFGLGAIAAAENDLATAEVELGKAKKLDPHRGEPAFELYRLYDKAKRTDDALRELDEAARLDSMDASIPPIYLGKLVEAKKWEKVVAAAPRALYTVPFNGNVHLWYARGLIEIKRLKDARQELDAAADCELTDAQKTEAAELGTRAGRT